MIRRSLWKYRGNIHSFESRDCDSFFWIPFKESFQEKRLLCPWRSLCHCGEQAGPEQYLDLTSGSFCQCSSWSLLQPEGTVLLQGWRTASIFIYWILIISMCYAAWLSNVSTHSAQKVITWRDPPLPNLTIKNSPPLPYYKQNSVF